MRTYTHTHMCIKVLRPLEGAGFKEAGAYSLKNNRGYAGELGRSKVHRFAYINSLDHQIIHKNVSLLSISQEMMMDDDSVNEELAVNEEEGATKEEVTEEEGYHSIKGEPFLSADGSVIYMFESATTPFKIFKDNPRPFLLFALREPISRTWSDFRYLAHNYVPHRITFAKATIKVVCRLL
jgi:hypothetical protein